MQHTTSQAQSCGELSIVDSQIHLNYLGIKRGLSLMTSAGIAAALIDETRLPGTLSPNPNTFLLPNGARRSFFPTSEIAVERYPARFAFVTHIDPKDPELEALVRLAKERPGCLAIRIIVGKDAASTASFADGSHVSLFGAAEKCRLPIFIYLPGRSDLVQSYAERFPDLPVIIDHLGVSFRDLKGGRAPAEFERQFNQTLVLARYPSVYLKWCHAPEIFRDGFPYPSAARALQRALNAFGPQRLMWAADYTQSRQHYGWRDAYSYIFANDISTEDAAWITCRTVRTVLEWPCR
jgi:L-fuconolactonase